MGRTTWYTAVPHALPVSLQTMAVLGLALSSGCYYALSAPANDQAIAVAKKTCEAAGLQGLKKLHAQQWPECMHTRLDVNFRLPPTVVAKLPAIGNTVVTVELSDPEGARHRLDCYPQTGLVIMGPSSYCYYGVRPAR